MTLSRKLDPLLEPAISAVRRLERFLGPDDDWVEDDRRILYEAAQRHLGHLHTFTREKGRAEYVTTVKADPDTVEGALMPPYQRNLVSTRKYRTYRGGGKQYACGSFVIDGIAGDFEASSDEASLNDSSRSASREHGYVEQHHVYLFETEDGYTDVHAHRETSATEGDEHLTETHQEQGDPHVLFDVFDRVGLAYHDRGY